MTDPDEQRFRLHPETSGRDATGRVVSSAVVVDSAAAILEANSGETFSGDAARGSSAARHYARAVCFIPDEHATSTVLQILQSIDRGTPFCVTPAYFDCSSFVDVDDVMPAPSEGGSGNDSRCHLPATCKPPQFQCLSSGTSGAVRRIQRSHQSWIRSFEVNASLLNLSIDDSYAIVGNLSHSLPLYAVLEACYLGADVQLLGGLRPDRQLQVISGQGTTVLYLTPTQARQLCRLQTGEPPLAPGVRHVLCGGGKLDDKTRRALEKIFTEASIIEFYGASETSFITMSDEQSPPGSVGRAYPGVSLKILDACSLPTSEVGEVWVRSEYLFTGYVQGDWRDTQQDDGYLSIGELGRLDPQGNLYLCGRKSRQANVADTKVFLEEIEGVLLQHAAVQHCVVVTRQDAMRGEYLVAVVQGSHDDGLRAELLKYARQQLGATLAPKQILFVEVLPCLAAGKPDIRQIQSMVASL